MVFASRNGQRRKFTDLEWKEMPHHKYGWTVSAEEPEEVKAYREKVITQKDVEDNPDFKGLEGKTVGVPVAPGSPISPDDEIAKIEAELQTKMHHLTRKKLEGRLVALKGNIETKSDATGNE